MLVLLSGCTKKPDEPGTPNAPGGPKVEPSQKGPLGKPDFTLSAADLFNERRADAAAAEAKYKGKVIEVSGTVHKVARYGNQKVDVVELKSADGKPSVGCAVSDRNIAGKIGPEQTVRIKGRYNTGLIALVDCELVEKGPETLIPLTAEALAKEFTADAAAGEKRLGKSVLLLTGEVAAVKTDPTTGKHIELKGDGKTVIRVHYIGGEWPATYTVGAKVKMTAEIVALAAEPGLCKLTIGFPLDTE